MKDSYKVSDEDTVEKPDPVFWQSEMYFRSNFREMDGTKFTYYDDASILKYLFYHWVNKWVYVLFKRNVEPYKFHPLPVSDQLLYWHPIFSKHVSDGLVRLDNYETARLHSRGGKAKRPYKSILLRALLKTFWLRLSFLALGIVASNVLSLSISIFVKKLIGMLGAENIHVAKTIGLLVAIICCQIGDGVFNENVSFYVWRLISIVHYLFSTSLFQHSVSYRRKFSNDINGSNKLKVCNQVLHSCSADSECSKNPLFCQAMRYQSKEITPKFYSFEWNDSYYISQFFEVAKHVIDFLTSFGYGIFLLSYQLKAQLWILYVVGLIFSLLMLSLEICNTLIMKYVMYARDFKITKCNEIIPYLSLIKKMFYDDIAINIITKARNIEVALQFFNFFFFHFNGTLYVACMNIAFIIIQRHFVKGINKSTVVTDIDTGSFMGSFYLFMRIVHSMFLIPRAIKIIGMAIVSFRRMDKYLIDSAPNFYISDTKFTGSTTTASSPVDTTNQVPNNAVVYYKDASFTWVNSREDLLTRKYETFLKNVNFELKRGQMAVVTGAQGSGKSNFIKSMLGEMTLVGGSMAVVPLHTSMPIFYASQDIWLKQGTVRSNITLGYKFDEDVYNTVLKAVELDYDVSTWEKGDLRVVSDNAPSLSGGQRVRVELARAIYAYLIFHKVNKEYNNSKCSFLMCLDASFHGLDPYVTKTIYNNLFNLNVGLLVKDDLSIVLTASKQSIETALKSTDLSFFFNAPVYAVKDERVKFYGNLHDVVRNRKHSNDFKYLSALTDTPYHVAGLTKDMLSLCSSGHNTTQGRAENTMSLFSRSFKLYLQEELAGVKLNRYTIFLTSALFPFLMYVLLAIAVIIMDTIKYVFSSNLSDYVSKHINDYKDGASVDLDAIKSHSNFWLRMLTLFVCAIILVSFTATLFMTSACVISARNIHEYVLDSIFRHSSTVIKVKKQIHQVMTYFACDIFMLDDVLGLMSSLVLLSSMQLLIGTVTIFYLIPISIPFILLSLCFIFYFILFRYVCATRNMNFGYLETSAQVNNVLETAISGSSVLRSFKEDSYLESKFLEQRDYKARCKFFLACIPSWAKISFYWVFNFTILLVLLLPIVLDRFTKYKLSVGYFGLALSLSGNVLNSFKFFSMMFSNLEMILVAVERFKYFIPPGDKLKFQKFLNTHEEFIVNPTSRGSAEINRTKLLARRALEFRAECKKYFGLRKLFYHPKLNVLDVGRYLTPEHSGVRLNDVCVYTSRFHSPEGLILRNINVSSNRSEIIGIIGRTGAGKTTLLSVLQNIIANRTGSVLLDGKDLNEIPMVVLRQIIGVLPQLPFAFKGWTVRRFLDPRRLFTDDEINAALTQCGLLKFVNELPGGNRLDTVLVSEEPFLYNLKNKGGKSLPRTFEKERSMSMEFTQHGFDSDSLLSNTQLRTLWFAKLVLYRYFFRMIIVDEPPEEDLLEPKAVKKDDLDVPIYELLHKYFNHCTTFVTAHDVKVLKNCTSVWVVHEGRLVRTCKASDIAENESLASIIEESLRG